MKLLVQSDDYGFTRSIIDGMCSGFENGIITCAGLFTNMPHIDYAVKRMKEYPHICFGIDINVVSGPCVSPKKKLPTLVNQETGMFIQTSERQKDPRWPQDIFKPYDEVFLEGCAQVELFIEKVGKKPEYLTSHSTSGSQTYLKAIQDVARKYQIPFTYDYYPKFVRISMHKKDSNPYSYENQMMDKVPFVLSELERLKDKEYVILGVHCGFVDDEIMKLSRCNLERAYDHAMLTNDKVKEWLKEHQIQLISYRDL